MRHFVKLTLIVFALMISCLPVNSAIAREYLLGPGDILTIGVWGYEELKLEELAVRPDGKIAFPLVGEVEATGKTVSELTGALTSGLSVYVKEPIVTVNILKFRTTRVYVLGEVQKPGMYEIERSHNLLDAIGMAGSYTKNAAKRKVHIIRQDRSAEPIKANLLNLLTKGDMSQNYTLNDGDVVYLSDNGRVDFARDILPWISATYQVSEIQNN